MGRSDTGGIGRHYAALLPALAAQGVEIDLVVFTDGPVDVRATLGIRPLVVHRTGGMPRLAALLHRPRALRRAYLADAYDRVFAPEWMGLGALLPRDAPLVTNLATGVDLAHEISGRRRTDLPASSRPAVVLQSRLHPTARLVLAGAGGDDRFEPSRAALLDRVPPAARDRVTFLGHVSGDELYGAVAAADVVMCPSRWEGFGNVAVEVMAAGAPLVVTSGSGFDDFCTDGADCLMVPPAAPDALAAALAAVLDDPVVARRRATRAAAGVDRFAPAPVAADLRAAVDRMLSRVAIPA